MSWRGVNGLGVLCGVLLWAAGPAPAQAETLRCSGGSASEGDTAMAVAYKCGEPLMRQDMGCAPIVQVMPVQPWPYPPGVVYGQPPCLHTEAWLYDRGPGNMMATVRFVSGVVNSISYNRQPN